MARTKRPTTIHIHGRRWFRRSYGNTYSSVAIYVDGEHAHKSGPTGGYGQHYEAMARTWLKGAGFLPGIEENDNGSGEALWRYCQRKKIKLISEVSDVARERDL